MSAVDHRNFSHHASACSGNLLIAILFLFPAAYNCQCVLPTVFLQKNDAFFQQGAEIFIV